MPSEEHPEIPDVEKTGRFSSTLITPDLLDLALS